jgi:hypothetical protein
MAGPAAATISNLQSALVRRYSRNFVTTIEWAHGVAAAVIPKVGWSGQPTWAMRVGSSPTGSQDFVTAQNNGSLEITNIVQPQITTYQQDFGVATLEGRLMAAASDKEGTLFDKMVGQIDGIMEGVAQSYSGKIYRTGFGEMTQINPVGSNVTSGPVGIFTLYPEDSIQFEVGMRVQFASAISGVATRNVGAVARIFSINFRTGQITFNAPAGGPQVALNTLVGAVANGDFIFRAGDRDPAGTVRQCITGFEGQFNDTSTLFGVTRTNDSRLQGLIITNAGGTEEENIIDGMSEVRRYGGNTDMVFINPTRLRNITKLAMGRYRPASLTSPIPGIGVKGINLMTLDGKSVDIFDDPFCPVNRIWGIEKKSLQVFLAGGNTTVPHFLNPDGVGNVLRITNADGVESRVGYYAEMGCNAPIHNFGVIY